MPRRKPYRFESGLAHHLDRFMLVRVRPRAPTLLYTRSRVTLPRPVVTSEGRLEETPIYWGPTVPSRRMLGAGIYGMMQQIISPGPGAFGCRRLSHSVWAAPDEDKNSL